MRYDGAFGIEINRLKQWLNHNGQFIIVNSIILCYLYGTWIFDRAPLVDTMLYINMPDSTYNWLSIGREGAVLSKWIFQQMYYNPYVATAIGYIFISLGGILLGYIGYRCSKRCGYVWTLVPYMFVSPIFAEQFYFKLQILEIGWAYILCAVSVALNYFIIFRKKRYLYIISILTMIWSFHTYQTFVITYAVMIGFAYVLLCLSGTICEDRKDVTWRSLLIEHIVIFGVANAAGQMITSIFFRSSGYLESTIAWKTVPMGECIKKIIGHASLMFFGGKIVTFLDYDYKRSIFYTAFYGIFALITIIFMLRAFLNNRKSYSFVMLLAAIGIQFSPLLLTLYMGNIPSIRAQLIYPLVMIFDGIICYVVASHEQIQYRRIVKIVMGGVLIAALWQQMSITLRLVYTDEVRADEDIRFAETLNVRLIEMDVANKPIVFVGGYDNVLNPVCVRGEIIGQSVFNMFTESEPHYAVSTWHTCSEMNTIGIRRKQASNEQVEYARSIAIDMPIWPARNSVKDVGDFVVVKLSADNWAEEILSAALMPVNGEHIEYADDLVAAIEPISKNDTGLNLAGWCIKEDVNSDDIILKAFVKHDTSNQFYMLPTSVTKREELTQFFGDAYQNGGFIAKINTDELIGTTNEYSVYVGYEELGNYHLKDMGNLADLMNIQ